MTTDAQHEAVARVLFEKFHPGTLGWDEIKDLGVPDHTSDEYRRHADDVIAAAEAAAWQPIETYRPGVDPDFADIAGQYANGVHYVDATYFHDGQWSGRKLEPPTHWRRRPEPPKDPAP